MQDERRRTTILVVDDTPANIDVLSGILAKEFRVKVAINGPMALEVVERTPPDLILLDIMMPGMDGYEVCCRLKANPMTKAIPVIFVTAMADVKDEKLGLEIGAVDYLTKPVNPDIVLARVRTHLTLYELTRQLEAANSELEERVRLRTAALQHSQLEIIRRLGRAAEFKDNETGLHVMRMSNYACVIGKALGMNEVELDLILNAMPMHDVGKIGIPDSVLLKRGKLDADEWSIIIRHPEIGAEIIGEHDNPLLHMAREVALTHHEKWNGKGYPRGLKGEDIPLSGRIAAIADVFDALTTERPYKKAWSVEQALELLQAEAGEHFDPELVRLFVENLDEVLSIKKKYSESGN